MRKEQDEDQSNYSARVDAVLEPPEVKPLVAAYFDLDGPFAADSFDTLGVNDPYAIGADDLLACTFLDVRFPPLAVRHLLNRDRETLAVLLRDVPREPHLWEAPAEVLPKATEVWDFFRKSHGVDVVLAGKLLARKRPRLIPIIDKWVVRALGFPKGMYWPTLQDCLRDQGRRDQIEALRPAGLSSSVTILRLLDVAIWMQYSESTNARNARLAVGLPVRPRAGRGRR